MAGLEQVRAGPGTHVDGVLTEWLDRCAAIQAMAVARAPRALRNVERKAGRLHVAHPHDPVAVGAAGPCPQVDPRPDDPDVLPQRHGPVPPDRPPTPRGALTAWAP